MTTATSALELRISCILNQVKSFTGVADDVGGERDTVPQVFCCQTCSISRYYYNVLIKIEID